MVHCKAHAESDRCARDNQRYHASAQQTTPTAWGVADPESAATGNRALEKVHVGKTVCGHLS